MNPVDPRGRLRADKLLNDIADRRRRFRWRRQRCERLNGVALQPFVYRDFGSLVSLGKYTTVGNLMGAVKGKGLMVEAIVWRVGASIDIISKLAGGLQKVIPAIPLARQ